MNEIFQCGDSGALVAYLYDECSPGEYAVIAAHIKGCVACASEIDALSATRRTLASWTPPDLALGFQLTRSDVGPAKILEPKIAWWRAPLPAWAQAAAALVIFAAGLSVGTLRTGSTGQIAETPSAASVPVESRTSATTASRDDLAQLEKRLRTEFGQLRSTPTATPVPARGSDDALMRQVTTLIEESAAQERRGFTERMLNMADLIERQRRVDMAQIGNSMGQFRGATRDELRQQNEAFNEALRRLVSDSAR
jgi:putative zinc finger protein